MPTTRVTPLPSVRTKITVYEPRQTPEQEEVVLDEFELDPTETRDIDLRSATAAFRQTPVPGGVVEASEPVPDQEPREGVTPDVRKEMDVGGERASRAQESSVATGEAIKKERERRAAQATRTREEEEAAQRPEPKHRAKGKAREKDTQERAERLTKGQEREEAVNPSAQTGSTGQSDVGEETSAAGSQSEEAVAQNKKSTRRSE